MRVDAWLAAACADAERRGLPQLKPLLETLARSTTALREHERRHDERSADERAERDTPSAGTRDA